MSAIDGEPDPGALVKGMSATLLDRMAWRVSLSVLAYGVRISVRINQEDIVEDVARRLPPGWQRGEFSGTGRVYSLIVEEGESSDTPRGSVYVNGAVLARGVALQGALRAFEADVQLHVAEMAPERVFVHAGVVGYRGRAIVLPGRSFAGKTTLVRELVRAGAQYYSDEYAVLDSRGMVHAYPRPPSIRRAGGAGIPKYRADEMGAHGGGKQLPVGLVVVCQFRKGAEWRPQPLSPGHGIQALFANTVPARRIPETVLATLHQVVLVAPVVESERGEAFSVVAPILKLALWDIET